MCREWPFFSTRLGMLEMVFTKTSPSISRYYDEKLVDPSLWTLGKELRKRLAEDIKAVLMVENNAHLMEQNPWGPNLSACEIFMLNLSTCCKPNFLCRTRATNEGNTELDEALMVTIAGIAAGMRNTG
ncbi:Phosphoenolpyruvate carboxylase [Grimontia hollisae]|uniref:Phosphoenolpyruvate carboxylase n=1 Tax=Grimontia hollisae TaxID=673 RepID=A0A377HHK4_GRIHO|nr:Phosphoenolpyruvate carboxylase [Grimontia hollisae]